MHYLIALIYFVLALLGFDGVGSHTMVTRSVVNGVDVLYSKTRIIADVVDITCIRSASGQCHYRLLMRDCTVLQPRATAGPACASDPAQQFVVATGASREIAGLPARFTLCVGQDDDAVHTECETLPAAEPMASRWWNIWLMWRTLRGASGQALLTHPLQGIDPQPVQWCLQVAQVASGLG